MLSLPVKSHAATHTRNAENCTQPVDTHKLVCFVTFVLNTPWMLIKAPEIKADRNPHIKKSLPTYIYSYILSANLPPEKGAACSATPLRFLIVYVVFVRLCTYISFIFLR